MSAGRLIIARQWLHIVLLAALFVPLVWASRMDAVRVGRLWGIGTLTWFWIATAIPIVHQVYVWFCWRTELHARLLSRMLGPRGFGLYAVGFAVLGISRLASVFLLASANRGTVSASVTQLRVLAIVVAIPSAYLFCSVARYFGFRRAMGIDHFDPACRTQPLVRQGIFCFTSNGMYAFGFLLLWVPGLWCASAAALVAAAFNHLYIWVHYFATERPDMQRIYGNEVG
jgi:hypothetical protein